MTPNLKVIHLVCACLFLGNVIVSGVWALLAERTRNHAIIQFSNKMVLITDAMFTFLGAVGVVWTGHGMAGNFGGAASHDGSRGAYWLLPLSGLIWLFVLVPSQFKQRAVLQQYSEITEDYWRLSRIWKIAGAISTVLPLPIVYFMVTKSV